MITAELKSLIDKYCMGKEPTDAQMDEIMDKAVQVNADFQEVAAFIEEMKNKVQTVVTYTLTLTEVTNQMMAMITARAVLGWDSAQSRENFANLPMVVKTTTNQDEASEIYEKLSRGGMVIEPNAVEGTAQDKKKEAEDLFQMAYDADDEAKAAEYFEKAAILGHVEAQAELGESYRLGMGVEENDDKAIYWHSKAAEQGNIMSLMIVHKYYRDKDDEKALACLQKMLEVADGKELRDKLYDSVYDDYTVADEWCEDVLSYGEKLWKENKISMALEAYRFIARLDSDDDCRVRIAGLARDFLRDNGYGWR